MPYDCSAATKTRRNCPSPKPRPSPLPFTHSRRTNRIEMNQIESNGVTEPKHNPELASSGPRARQGQPGQPESASAHRTHLLATFLSPEDSPRMAAWTPRAGQPRAGSAETGWSPPPLPIPTLASPAADATSRAARPHLLERFAEGWGLREKEKGTLRGPLPRCFPAGMTSVAIPTMVLFIVAARTRGEGGMTNGGFSWGWGDYRLILGSAPEGRRQQLDRTSSVSEAT